MDHTYDSEYTNDSSSVYSSNDDSDNEYQNHSRFTLGFCELFAPLIHGNSDDSQIYYKFLFISNANKNDIQDNDDFISERAHGIQQRFGTYQTLHVNNVCVDRDVEYHTRIVKYYRHTLYDGPQILEIVDGPGDYTTAINKTHFLRLFQRKWRNIINERKRLLKLRKNVRAIQYRRIHGKWPAKCY